MPIVNVSPADRPRFLELVNAEIRPDRAKTTAWDDFPVILGPENSSWQLIFKTDDGIIAGCIAALIRLHKTSCGEIPIAGVGSVVTHKDFRGKGISSALQNEMLKRLKGQNIPLGVLWTDQPEIYSGRGFVPAGWEIHASVTDLAISEPLPEDFSIREFTPEDTLAVDSLFNHHILGTVREPGNSQEYYTMKGTRGFVLANQANEVMGSVFCGKGGDFPDYICEWAGDTSVLPHLFQYVHKLGLADQVLIPAGAEELVNALVDMGSGWVALPSGNWVVIDPITLVELVKDSVDEIPEDTADPVAWLGGVDPDGMPLMGALTTAVWGFDSV